MPLKPTVNVSVVVLTADIERRILRECLTSVWSAAQTGNVSVEVILVDNASTSRLCDWAVEEFPWLTILRFESQVGFSTGNNAGYRVSNGRYLLQLNNDTVVDAWALRRMVDFLDTHPEVGAIGPRLVNPDKTLQIGYYARAFPTVTYNAFHLFWINRLLPNNRSFRRHMLLDEADVTREVDEPAGASLFYRREVLFALGLLDEDFTFAFDDVDICWRIKRAGWKIYYVAEAQVIHYGGMSLKKSTADMTHYYLNGLLTYYMKNYGSGTFLVIRLIVIMAIIFRISILTIVVLVMRKKRWEGNISNYFHYIPLLLRSLVFGYRPQILSSSGPHLIQQKSKLSNA